MKTFLVALSMALAGISLATAPLDAEARRLGGGKPAGMQRQAPAKPADATPAQPAQQPNNATTPTAGAAPAAAGAAAGAGKRSWLGPIAGLAAGLGIAALLSHLGLGAAFANMLTMVLLAVIAFVVIRWLLRRFGGGAARGAASSPRLATAGGPSPGWSSEPAGAQPLQRSSTAAALPAAAAGAVGSASASRPEGFDAEAFERVAKMIFIRLQAANDAGQVDDLRRFTTPEMFASLRLDLQERGGKGQQTDVLQLDAKLLDTAQEDAQWIASVRFSGLIRENPEAPAEPFDEMWHLVKPVDGSRDWAIAGITPAQ